MLKKKQTQTKNPPIMQNHNKYPQNKEANNLLTCQQVPKRV